MGDYFSGMEEVKPGKPREKMRAGTPRGGDYATGLEEKKPKPKSPPKPKPTPKSSAPFSSAVEGEAQAASREAAKRQAARSATSALGKGFLRGAARFAGPVGAAITAYQVGDALKDTKPALWARDKVAGFLNRRTEYKQEQAEKAALEAARKRGGAKRNAGQSDYMKQVSASALKKFQDKELPGVAVAARKRAMPVADIPTVKSKPAAPKVDRMKEFMADIGEDNAVFKRLKEKGYAKGGHVKANGVARKGKTRGRLI